MTAPDPYRPRHRVPPDGAPRRRRPGGALPPIGTHRPRRARNPNRWLLYGFGLGILLGYAIDMMLLGIGVGLFIGTMLRNRDVEEARELAEEEAANAPAQGDTPH